MPPWLLTRQMLNRLQQISVEFSTCSDWHQSWCTGREGLLALMSLVVLCWWRVKDVKCLQSPLLRAHQEGLHNASVILMTYSVVEHFVIYWIVFHTVWTFLLLPLHQPVFNSSKLQLLHYFVEISLKIWQEAFLLSCSFHYYHVILHQWCYFPCSFLGWSLCWTSSIALVSCSLLAWLYSGARVNHGR
jgi:hypothetical protein